MTVLVATPKAVDANAYLTVARAKEILRTRLYTTAWDGASETPDAEGYLAQGGASTGAGTADVDTGEGTWAVGTVFRFAGHATEYTVSVALSEDGTLQFTPNLTADVADDEALVRLTASDREKALIWATRVLDEAMDWLGTRRTTEQALRWPRTGVYDRDGTEALDYDTIPADLEEATAELALFLLDRDRTATPDLLGQGFSQAKVGSLSVQVDRKQVLDVIPDHVLSVLSSLGEIRSASASGLRNLPLRRS